MTPTSPSEEAARRHFPSLAGRRCARIDLDAAFRRWRHLHPERFEPGGPNPVLHPEVFAEMLAEAHAEAGAEWSFGGYLEDRRNVLAGTYLDSSGSYLHLGVDFNVPEGTSVVPAAPATVMLVDDDQDRDGGWGPRVFMRGAAGDGDGVVAIFAHLRAPRCRPGDRLGPLDAFAEVGGPPYNGNWHPHLHLQLIRWGAFQEMLTDRFQELDGYGPATKKAELAKVFPDPLKEW